MRSQPNCFEVVVVVVVVDVVFVVVVVLNLDVVVQATSKVDLMLHRWKQSSWWVGWWWWWGGVNTNNRVKPNSVELILGCVEVELGL